MKVIIQENDKYVLRFDPDDEVISLIREFCNEQNIKSGYFWGLGAVYDAVLSFYDLDKKKYIDRVFNENLEIIGFRGNISTLQTKIVIHAHGTFADSSYKTKAGHVKKMIVSVTCEVILKRFNKEMKRKYDLSTGANLLTVE